MFLLLTDRRRFPSAGILFCRSCFSHQQETLAVFNKELRTQSTWLKSSGWEKAWWAAQRAHMQASYRQSFVVSTASITSCVKLYESWLFVSSSRSLLRLLLIRPGITDFIMESCRWGVRHQFSTTCWRKQPRQTGSLEQTPACWTWLQTSLSMLCWIGSWRHIYPHDCSWMAGNDLTNGKKKTQTVPMFCVVFDCTNQSHQRLQ